MKQKSYLPDFKKSNRYKKIRRLETEISYDLNSLTIQRIHSD